MRRQPFMRNILSRIGFIDETSLKTNMAKTTGWSTRGKALIRRAAVRTYDDLWRAAGHVCDLFTDEECYNVIKAADYETD